ncbi:hypothetical protein J3458_020984 [Metarhizium acridum]|uniref:uncharacterized protein n=1 Tax=Metarhizium acridum TaxID=92637 RepID=UPI001C6AAC48|nr:hypothetical protein J3458_020984 [Metarhizium acridum]
MQCVGEEDTPPDVISVGMEELVDGTFLGVDLTGLEDMELFLKQECRLTGDVGRRKAITLADSSSCEETVVLLLPRDCSMFFHDREVSTEAAPKSFSQARRPSGWRVYFGITYELIGCGSCAVVCRMLGNRQNTCQLGCSDMVVKEVLTSSKQ